MRKASQITTETPQSPVPHCVISPVCRVTAHAPKSPRPEDQDGSLKACASPGDSTSRTLLLGPICVPGWASNKRFDSVYGPCIPTRLQMCWHYGSSIKASKHRSIEASKHVKACCHTRLHVHTSYHIPNRLFRLVLASER